MRGSYIDFRFKAASPLWPPPWLAPLRGQLHVATAQWGLGAHERYLEGEGDEWLLAALRAGEHLLEHQHRGGAHEGGWRHFFAMPHTYRLQPPWLSAIAQGEAASLLVRLHLQTGEERFAAAARRALLPMERPVSGGGTLASLAGAPFPEEYPTVPPSFVLNGAIFALWGYRDVGAGLGEAETLRRFEELTAALAANLHLWDTGSWSLYDLYPHPLPNTASSAYHLLHIRQLEALDRLCPQPELREVGARFREYRARGPNRRRALARKVAFRLTVPRNPLLAHRLPPPPRAQRRGHEDDTLVLCYHAVSADWEAALAIPPGQLDAQLDHLAARGYRGVTFAEAVAGREAGRRVAITFDDAYRSVLRLAKPALDAHSMPATVFVPTDFPGAERPMSWPGIDRWLGVAPPHELTPLSWEELRGLSAEGWEVGSHTRSHPRLTGVGDAELAAQLAESRAECERRLERPCESLAYPYGDVDERVMEAAMAAGYAAAADLGANPGPPSPYRWPRVGVYRADGRRAFRLKMSRPLRRLQDSRAWPILEAGIRPFRPTDVT